MDFLANFELPFLTEKVGLSQLHQSMFLEALTWALLYTVASQVGSIYLRRVYRSRFLSKEEVADSETNSKRVKIKRDDSSLYARAKKHSGIMCQNAQDDCVLFTIIFIHHFIAGSLMAYGLWSRQPVYFRHGYLLETGFELSDMTAMILKMYPYGVEFKRELLIPFVCHHLPGTLLGPFLLESELYENPHLQAIVICLLLGAAVSLIVAIYTYGLDFSTHRDTAKATVVFALNMAFFVYCRWFIFPREALALLADVRNNPALNEQHPWAMKMLYTGGAVFCVFNAGILGDSIPKLFRYIKRCRDGVTPMEDKPVPSSRDSIMMKKDSQGGGGANDGRRRSSLFLLMVDTFTDGQPVGKDRRARSSFSLSSFSTVIGMNTIEDVTRVQGLATMLESTSFGTKDGHADSSVSETHDDSDLDAEDEAAILGTLAAMSAEHKKMK